MKETLFVRRLKCPCCGMKVGEVYEASSDTGDVYMRVKLPSGEWTSDHYAPGFFERVEKVKEAK